MTTIPKRKKNNRAHSTIVDQKIDSRSKIINFKTVPVFADCKNIHLLSVIVFSGIGEKKEQGWRHLRMPAPNFK